MAFLTIFTAPKPFTNPHINIIQRNALSAWTKLADVDVILVGDEPGIPEAAKEFGVRNITTVERDANGVPLVSSVMEIGHSNSNSPVLCYANADMILMSDLVEGARKYIRTEKRLFNGWTAMEPGHKRVFRFQRRLGITFTS